MKKEYSNPSIQIVSIGMHDIIATSNINSITGGGVNLGGAGTQPARSAGRRGIWD